MKLDLEMGESEVLTPMKGSITYAQLLAAFKLPLDAELVLVTGHDERAVAITPTDTIAVSCTKRGTRRPRKAKVPS